MGPHSSFADYIELTARMFVPYSFLGLLFVFSVVSVPYPVAVLFEAPLLLMALYYWCVYRPTLLPPWLVFIGGLFFDLATGMPALGLSAFLFLLCRMAVIDQRRFLMGQGFVMVWIGFMVLDMAFHVVQWGIFSILNTQLMSVNDLAVVLMLGVFVFPPVYGFLYITHKFLPAPPGGVQSRLGSQKPNVSL